MSDPVSTSANLSARPFQMLVRIAQHSRIGDPQGCAAVFALLETGRELRAHLGSILARQQLCELGFTVLVSLYAMDPAPVSVTELANDAQVSDDVILASLDSLAAKGWISHDIDVQLTDRGRTLTEEAVRPFLIAVSRCGDALTPGQNRTLKQVCTNLRNQLPTHSS